MRSQHRSVNEVGGLNHRGIESSSIAAWNREGDRIGFELGLYSSIAADVVDKHDAWKFMVNLVVEIAGDESAGIEDGDRRLRPSSRTGQLSDERKDQMGRRVQAFDRTVIRRVVQVRLDRNLLACPVSGVAAT